MCSRLQALFNFDELGDAIVHFLNSLVFGQTETTTVGDVVDSANGFGVFTGGAAHLQVVLVANGFEFAVVLGEFWYL